MTLRMIDQELITLSDQLKELASQARYSSSEKYDRIASEHQRLRGLEAELTSKVRLLEQNSRRAKLVGQQDAAILHYCSRLANHLKHYLSLANSAFSKITWLKILQKRANSNQTRQQACEIQEEQLLSVFSRQQELEQAKNFLIEKLQGQEVDKKALESQFLTLQVIRENHLASAILQLRLGHNLVDAMASPLLKTMKDILKGYVLPALRPLAFRRMQASLFEYQKTVKSYLDISRLEAMASLDMGLQRSSTLSPKQVGHIGDDFRLEDRKLVKQEIQERLTQSKNDYRQCQKELDSPDFAQPVLKLMQNQ